TVVARGRDQHGIMFGGLARIAERNRRGVERSDAANQPESARVVVTDDRRRERSTLGIGNFDVVRFDDQIADRQHEAFVADHDARALALATERSDAARVGDRGGGNLDDCAEQPFAVDLAVGVGGLLARLLDGWRGLRRRGRCNRNQRECERRGGQCSDRESSRRVESIHDGLRQLLGTITRKSRCARQARPIRLPAKHGHGLRGAQPAAVYNRSTPRRSAATKMTRKKPEELRSHRWFGESDMRGFGHHSRISQMGYSRADYAGKPIIAIINTWSDINSCHAHFRQRADEVKRGVLQAGGFPLEMPALALAEVFQKPTTMLYRNLLAMETEELLRSYPVDGAVLMGGCDKTTPALLMGAISMNLPAIFMPAGPMLRGNWRDQPLGSGSDVWKYWAEKRAGNVSDEQWAEIEDGIARSPGHCMTMGTASTMTSAAEALGFTLPGAVSIPAADSRHARLAADTGRRIVDMVW